MQRILCKSKIHRATVTAANLEYEGSISIDSLLLEAADMLEYEQVHVLNLNNGARFETYTILAEPGSGEIVLNGAAARLAQPGDRVIIMSYALYDEAEVREHRPRMVFVDDRNRIPAARPLGGTPV